MAEAIRKGGDEKCPAQDVKKNNQAHKLEDHLIILLLSLTVDTA